MSDETRPPEDDWSPDETDIDGDPAGWSWLDDAVGAWDHLDDATDDVPAPGGFEAADDTRPHDEDGEIAPEPVPAAAGHGPADDAPMGHVDLGVPGDDTGEDGTDGTSGEDDPTLYAAFTPDDAVGTCSTAALAEALTLAGVDDATTILAALDGDQVDARDAVGAFDFAGVEARIEHAGLGELMERLAAGHEVLLGGAEPHALVAIDPASGEVVVEPLAGGSRTVVAIELFEDAWDGTANELMVVNADNPGIRLGGGEVCVLPVALGDML